MATERFERAVELFHRACDLPADERSTFLNRECSGDAALRAEVDSLLRYDDDGGKIIEAAEAGAGIEAIAAETSVGADELPKRIGGYRIIAKLGEGGMGEVFEAEQESPRRRVALKVIRAGHLSPKIVRRFEHEAFVLGQLQHPGIAHIYESGVVGINGRRQPYFAMELIRGARVNVFADEQHLNTRQRLELMARVCDAVQHAHQKGIIHRDLKPANILVVADDAGTKPRSDASGTGTGIDAIGQPKILDFGIARATDGDVYSTTMQTDVGQIVGTLAYMAPEQVEGDSRDIDTRCDVYALGVVMYEVLSGKRPYDLTNIPMIEAARIIREDDATRLSVIDNSLRGDVATIVAKAMEKDRERRYGSAAELAADIRRHLNDEPIAARPTSAFYQMRKFARRHSGLVGGAAAALLAIIIGAGISVRYAVEARRNAIEARRNANEARDREIAAERAGYRMSIAAANTAAGSGDMASALRYLDAAPESLRDWEWNYLMARADPVVNRLKLPEKPAMYEWNCAFRPDGVPIIAWKRGDAIEIVDMMTGEVQHRFDAPGATIPTLANNGSRLACYFPDDNKVTIWSIKHGTQLTQISTPSLIVDHPLLMFFTRDVNRFVLAEFQSISMYDASDGVLIASFPMDARQTVDASQHGGRIVVHDGRTIFVWDTVAERLIVQRPLYDVTEISVSPNGQFIAAGTNGDRSVIVLNGDSLTEVTRLRDHMNNKIEGVRWTADGESLIYVSDGNIFHWNLDDDVDGEPEIQHIPNAVGSVLTPVINRDDSLIALTTQSEAMVLTGGRHAPTSLSGHRSYVYFVKFSPSGGILASHDFSGELRFWDAESGKLLGELHVPWFMYLSFGIGWADDGLGVATGNTIWSALNRWENCPSSNIELARRCDGGIRTDRLNRDWHQSRIWRGRESPVTFVSSADDLTLLDTKTGRSISTTPGHRPYDVVSNGNNHWFASNDGVFDSRSGQRLHKLAIDYGLCLSPDGRRLAGGGKNGGISIFDTDSFKEIAQLRGHEAYVYDVDFSPDGTRLASASGDGTVRIWDARPRAERLRQAREIEELRYCVRQRLESISWDSRDGEEALGSYVKEHQPNDDELAILKDELFIRALRTQRPPALHDLSPDGQGTVVRFEPKQRRLLDRQQKNGAADWLWVQSDKGVSRTTLTEGNAIFERLSIDFARGGSAQYACSFTESAANAVNEFGWRIRARIRLNDDHQAVKFFTSIMLDSRHTTLPISNADGTWHYGSHVQDSFSIDNATAFHDIEWTFHPGDGTTRLFIDGEEIPNAPAPDNATHDPDDEGRWIQGHFTDAIVFGVSDAGDNNEANVDFEYFEFAILESEAVTHP